jgi:plasmid stabilization system protein ParE
VKARFTPAARRDLRHYLDYLDRHSRSAGERFVERLNRAVERLVERAIEGQEVTLLDGRMVHRWSIPPMQLYYRWHQDAFEIVRLRHGARRPIAK